MGGTQHAWLVFSTSLCFVCATTSAQDAAGEDNAPQLSSAQPDWGERDDEARTLFEAGVLAYDGGHYADAEDSFQRSYDLSGRPALLHNIATAAERANHDSVALQAYREFLRLQPNTPRRSRIEVRIRALEELLASGTEGRADPETTASSDPGPAPWIVVGVGGAALVAGVIMVGVAAADVAAVEGSERGSPWADVVDAYNRSEPLSIAGFVTLGVGIAALGAGLGWALAGGQGGDSASLRLEVQPGGLALRGTMP